MARHFSPHYAAVSSPSVAVATALADPRIKAAPGIAHATRRDKFAHLDFSQSTIATNEEVRMFTLKSSDRLLALKLSNSSTWAGTALTCNIGLFTESATHDGVVLDVNLFASGQDLLATLGEVDILTEAATIEDHHRGLPLWEMLALGAGSDIVDPVVDYDVVLTFATVTSVTVQDRILFEAIYTSGGN